MQRTLEKGVAAQWRLVVESSPQTQLRKLIEPPPSQKMRRTLESLPSTQLRKALKSLPSEQMREALARLDRPGERDPKKSSSRSATPSPGISRKKEWLHQFASVEGTNRQCSRRFERRNAESWHVPLPSLSRSMPMEGFAGSTSSRLASCAPWCRREVFEFAFDQTALEHPLWLNLYLDARLGLFEGVSIRHRARKRSVPSPIRVRIAGDDCLCASRLEREQRAGLVGRAVQTHGIRLSAGCA